MVFIDTKLLENNNLAMTGIEPEILDFGKPMPFPFGHIYSIHGYWRAWI